MKKINNTVPKSSPAFFFGVVPTAFARRLDVTANLKDAERTRVGGGARWRRGLTVVQLAASMALIVAALLLVRTLQNLHSVELGFDAERVAAFSIDPGPQGYSDAELRAFRARLLERLGRVPGVESATLADNAPFTGVGYIARIRAPGAPREDRVDADVFWIGPGYFETLGVPLLAGRDFTRTEAEAAADGAPNVAIVSRSLALAVLGVPNPVGRELVELGYREDTRLRIVGVVDDVRTDGLRGPPEPILYRPLGTVPSFMPEVVALVRSARTPAALEPAVRDAVAAIDPLLPFFRVEPLSEGVRRSIAEERLFVRLLTVLALLAALLAAVGLYGLIAHSVARQTREFGVRMALGANRATLTRLVLREAGVLALLGGVLGLAAAVGVARLLENRLFGVEPVDPATYALAAVAFAFVALAAAAVPARNATRVDPATALRYE